jgi:hypothetical protein
LEADEQFVISGSLNVVGRARIFPGRRFEAYEADFGQRADVHLSLKPEPTFGYYLIVHRHITAGDVMPILIAVPGMDVVG